MSWFEGLQKYKKFEDYNSIVKELSGNLEDKEAKLTLIKFMKTNLGLTFEMISGFKLFPLQELILKGLLYADNSLVVAARGAGKSTLLGIFAILQCIFNPGTQFCLISTNFRSSRRILDSIEKLVKHKKAELLRAAFPTVNFRRSNDIWKWSLPNQSEVYALPLNEQIRGFRSSTTAIDEMVGVSKELQENVIRPFLTVKQNIREELEYREIENELIDKGVITEADRISFPKNKFCGFSSASYQFMYLYHIFSSYIDIIMGTPQEKDPPKYFVIRFSYEADPQIFDMTQINSAKEAAGGETSENFLREFRGIFTRSGGGFFDVKRLHDCTVKVGDYPTVQLYGEKNAKYILSIDPSYSASKTSDHFSMAVYLLAPEQRRIFLVHSYAVAGAALKDHFDYFTYLLTHFNIEMIVIDGSGSEFIHGYNESTIAKEKNINLKFLDVDFSSENYLEELTKAKNQLNKTSWKIVYGQNFTSGTIRFMNEHLQNQINAEKVWFGSSLAANDKEVKKYEGFRPPFVAKNKNDIEMNLYDLISDQDELINMTKNQVGMIETRVTPLGALMFDLPQNLRRESSVHRMRRDSYTCLLLGCVGAKWYYDILYTPMEQTSNTFEPIFVY